MAEVFRALEPRPVGEPRLVAIKRMLPSVAAQTGAREMFRAEARLGAVIRSPNVVEVLAHGEEEGQPFLTLEYVRGMDLWRMTRALTRHGQRLDVHLAVFVVRELLRGLHAVHEASDEGGYPLGIVHRDVSPSNVLISVHGDVKLADFGIAVSHTRASHQAGTAPLSERAKGKLGYLAPEQVTGEPTDRRTDVFSAGVIAAELLMGRTLFQGGSELAVLLAIRDARIHPFIEFMSSLPTGLGEVIIEALGQSRDDRISSAAELWARLGTYAGPDEVALRTELGAIVVALLETSDENVPHTTPMFQEQLVEVTTLAALEPPTGASPDMPVVEYLIRTRQGEQRGPWIYARVIEAVAIGELGPNDEVSADGRHFRPIHSVPALSRHLPPSTMTPTTTDHETPREPDAVVSLADGGVAIALAHSVLTLDTGLWLCELGGVRKEVYVKDGVPEFVTSNLSEELLGEYLVSKNVITRGELDMALAVMPRFEGRLGDTLTALGLVEPLPLFQHIAAQVRAKLLDLFLWKSGTALFFRGVPPPQSGFPLGLEPWQILFEGIARRIDHGLEAERLGASGERRFAIPDELPEELAGGELPGELATILEALETPATETELGVVLLGRVPRELVAPSLVLLVQLGALVRVP
jgi:serine/threonine protein kinase